MLAPKDIVSKMMTQDSFSQWLGINLEHISLGSCTLSCLVNTSMLNGFEIAHGGICYSIADSALAFAANSYGFKCVSIETSISHTRAVSMGTKLTAKCREINRGKRIGIYAVSVFNETEKMVATFKGIVHISEDPW
jgi:acyl-CoA thioesterase